MEYIKAVNAKQKRLIKDMEFITICKGVLVQALSTRNKVNITDILMQMYPISELYFNKFNKYTESFIELIDNNLVNVDRFMNIYKEWGIHGLYTNLGMLKKELDKSYYPQPITEVQQYEEFITADSETNKKYERQMLDYAVKLEPTFKKLGL